MRVLKFIITHIKPYRIYVFGIFFVMCLVVVHDISKPLLIKKFVDITSGATYGNIWKIFIYYAALQCMYTCIWNLSDYCITRYQARFRADAAHTFMSQLYDYPYDFFQNQLSGSLTSKINDVFQNLPHLIFTLINPCGYFLLLILTSLVMLFTVSPIFVLGLLLFILLFSLIIFVTMKKSISLNAKYAEEKSHIIGHIADCVSNMVTVMLFANKNFEQRRFHALKKPFIAIAEKGGYYHIWLYGGLGVLTSCYALSVVTLLIIGHTHAWITPGDFVFVLMTNATIIDTLFNLSHTIKDFSVQWGAVDQAIDLLEKEKYQTHADAPNALTLVCNKGHIVFDNVAFRYNEKMPFLFQGFSVSIKPKEKIGLVGYSGGGKSTFINLILRLYEVNEGSIFIDNTNIRDVSQASLRASVSIISQDPLLFHRNLMENIRYGSVDASDEDVIASAKKARIHDFIMSLPEKYGTLVGERGVKLSGGQRQRVAIARAFLKETMSEFYI